MKKIIKTAAGLLVAGLLVAASAANAVTFNITGATFTPASGYGVGNNELDVTFGPSNYWNSTQSFTLNTVGQQSSLFNVGLINLREIDISQSETGSLGVAATFSFLSPFAATTLFTVQGTGAATTGVVNDCSFCSNDPSDYTINWAPVTFNFGTGGKFQLELTDLSFNETEQLVQTARLTLLALPSAGGGGTAVPEPTTIALLGLGLLGFAASRRSLKK